jgi:hypothetical protein
MIERIAGAASPPVQPAAAPRQAGPQTEKDARFARALYAALRPPVLDFSEASGDFENEESTRPAMTATILPKLTAGTGGVRRG